MSKYLNPDRATISVSLIWLCLTAINLLNPASAQANSPRLEIKNKEGETAWKCEGQFQGNNGQGLCVPFEDKDPGTAYKFYRGQVQSGSFNGNGVLVYTSQDRYQGQFQNGRPQGKGMYLAVSKNARYEGDFRNGFFHGQGTYTFGNGDRYNGQFAGGQPHGIGSFKVLGDQKKPGYTYTGQFYLGVINGNGTVVHDNKTQCTGVFYSNTLVGKGTCTFPKGSDFRSYTGELVDGLPDGRGTVIFSNGKQYTGEFRKGSPGITKAGS